jgi:hypothetical protein
LSWEGTLCLCFCFFDKRSTTDHLYYITTTTTTMAFLFTTIRRLFASTITTPTTTTSTPVEDIINEFELVEAKGELAMATFTPDDIAFHGQLCTLSYFDFDLNRDATPVDS